MHIIHITVQDKIATHVGDAYYVCGNSDFVVRFDFDEEWAALDVKTARFIREDGAYHDQVFSGNECPVPIISNTNNVRVGVFAGNLCTTTPARVPAAKSILCPGGVPAAPGDDGYNQIMQEVNETRGAANETAQALQEACGEGGLYLVTCVVHASDKEWHANRTQEEIRAAVAAKKTCLLSIRGKVYTYLDEQNNNSGESCPTFVRPGYYVSGQGIALETLKVEANGRIRTSYPGVSRTPNPRALTVKQGDKSTTYDGSSAVVVEIPQGGSGIADPGEAHQMLVSDAEGRAVWQPALAYKTQGNGVLLRETTLEPGDDPSERVLTTPWEHAPTAGTVCNVTYNGTVYECTAVDVSALVGATSGVVGFGMLSGMGMEGGNDDAPFLLLSYADVPAAPVLGAYGMLVTDATEAVTLSVSGPYEGAKQIDQEYVPDAVCTVHVPLSYDDAGKPVFGAADKTWAQVEEAYKAGRTIRVAAMTERGVSYGDVRMAFVAGKAGLVLAFEIYKSEYLHTSEGGRIVRHMCGATDGTIAILEIN